jgi:hypothetical protein
MIVFTDKFVAMATFLTVVRSTTAYTLPLSGSPPAEACDPIPKAFVSYSIEFSSFPEFAGTDLVAIFAEVANEF